MEQYLPTTSSVAIDGRVLLFVLFVSVGTALWFGFLPALQLAKYSGSDLAERVSEGGGRGMHRWRGLLASAEIALSLVLFTAAALLTQTMLKLHRQDTGMATDGVLTFKTAVSAQTYQGHNVLTALYQPLLERLQALPGVKAAGMINLLPLESWGLNGNFTLPGRPSAKNPNDWSSEFRVISPGYYAALGITMLRGRDFSEDDVLGTPAVAIINDKFAETYFGGQDPLGRQIQLDNPGPVLTVVGVYRSNRQEGVASHPDPEIDLCYLQIDPKSEWYAIGLIQPMTFLLRTTIPPESLSGAVRSALRDVDPAQPIYSIQTMESVRTDSLSGERFAFWLMLSFAALALVLAVAGVHGVMSYFVAQRTHEIGVGMALGASRTDVVRLVLRNASHFTIIGTLVGVGGALAAGNLLRSMLFDVSPHDPLTLFASAVLVIGVALSATFFPARRAASVDPMVALRYE